MTPELLKRQADVRAAFGGELLTQMHPEYGYFLPTTMATGCMYFRDAALRNVH